MDGELDFAAIRRAIGGWYAEHGRRLAFRASDEPWGVLVSEVMLQQTQVARVEAAWVRFMARFPTPSALAAAAPADAIRAWAGLGYNRRALNLWRAATRIVEVHGGTVPRSRDELRALPGVGEYTARAVAAICYREPVAAVDTNVRRVVLRVAGEAVEGGQSQRPMDIRRLQALADTLVDPDRPDRWTHAVMDIGATICRPRTPACDVCPLAAWCRSSTVAGERASMAPAMGEVRRPQSAPAVPFEQTSRWLRGRIVDRLRNAPDGDWLRFDGPIGTHDRAAVRDACSALAVDGLIELDGRLARLSSRTAEEVVAA